MAIEGLHNFRDVGGLPLMSGGVMQPGVLYRSAALGRLEAPGLDQLAATNIGVVVDFRTQEERRAAPDRLPTSRPFRVVELALLEGAMSDMTQRLAPAGTAPSQQALLRELNSLPTLGELYTGMLQNGGPQFAEVARFVGASTPQAPTAVLVHCTAGKDRTGVATALMLDAAGTRRVAVMEDYAASQEHLAGPWAEEMLGQMTSAGLPLTPALRTLVTGTPPEAIEHALTWVDETHGGSANYLIAGGLSRAELRAMCARLVG